MTSWYDASIVTAEGEAILAQYDDWAIRVLRRYKLVWSGWHGRTLRSPDLRQFNGGWGYRLLEGEDWSRLRLFLLSVLWRAAVSRLPEFKEIVIPREHVRQIGQMLVEGSAAPQWLYPARLIQLVTKGPRHNHTPVAAEIPYGAQGPILPRRERIFRFYLEGLIIHFDRDVANDARVLKMGHTAVGATPQLGLLALPFEGSFQAKNLAIAMAETFVDWPHMRPQIVRAMGRTDNSPAKKTARAGAGSLRRHGNRRPRSESPK